MIWQWVFDGLCWLIKLLVIPPPRKPVQPRIDPDGPCPACGNCAGELRAVTLVTKEVMVQKICKVCGASCFLSPVLLAGRRGYHLHASPYVGQFQPPATVVEKTKAIAAPHQAA